MQSKPAQLVHPRKLLRNQRQCTHSELADSIRLRRLILDTARQLKAYWALQLLHHVYSKSLRSYNGEYMHSASPRLPLEDRQNIGTCPRSLFAVVKKGPPRTLLRHQKIYCTARQELCTATCNKKSSIGNAGLHHLRCSRMPRDSVPRRWQF